MTYPYWILENDQPRQDVSPFDRGFAYGDGLFETMRVVSGTIPLLDFHMKRLEEGAGRLGIPVELYCLRSNVGQWIDGIDGHLLKLVVTRGVGGRGYLPMPDLVPTIVASLHPLPDYDVQAFARGIELGVSKVPLGRNSYLAGLKHLNRLEQVLARSQLHREGFVEGLMLDSEGCVVECVYSNIFICRENQVLTPALTYCGVAGVMRAWILKQLADWQMTVSEQEIRQEDVLAADEVFVCNSAYGIWPVRKLLEKEWSVGTLTRSLQKEVSAFFR